MSKTDFYKNDLDREKELLKDFFDRFSLKIIEIKITNNQVDIDQVIDFCMQNSAQKEVDQIEIQNHAILNKNI